MTEQAQMDLPGLPEKDDAFAHWVDMPMFEQEDLTPVKKVIVSLLTDEDVIAFSRLIGQRLTMRGQSSIWFPRSPYHASYDGRSD
jgi:hypothetical protein